MTSDGMSPQRRSADNKWRQAQHEMQRGHVERAIEFARNGLEEDGTYVELRLWLAQHYAQVDEPRKAAHELEEIIHMNQDHEAAWELLRKVDAAAAERLERLRDIAPDPFVAKRTGDLSDDLGSLEDLDDEEYGDESDDDPEEEAAVDESATSSGQAPAIAVPDDRGGYDWEYEQDREYLARWETEPVVRHMTYKIQELWKDTDAWEYVLTLCAHADKNLHPKLFEVETELAETLDVAPPELFVFPERCMHPVIIKDRAPMLAVPTGVLRAMNTEEMKFQVGRELGHLHTGYLAQMQVVKIITNRKAQLAGDLASSLSDFLGDNVKGWDAKLSKEEVLRLKRLGHAWQQRCELTADRAGLICCEDIGIACAAVAKTTAKSVDEASILTVDRFLRQFEGQEVGELARIPVEESPSRSPSYAAYRIHMLRWWASTPQCKALLSG